MAVLAALYDIDPLEVHFYNLASFTDLINSGVSDDEDMRVFEIGCKGPSVSAWAEHSLFLTDDTSLLGKWAELFADIARTKALEAIKRAVVNTGSRRTQRDGALNTEVGRLTFYDINDAALPFPDAILLTI